MKRKLLIWMVCVLSLLGLYVPAKAAGTMPMEDSSDYQILIIADTQDTARPQEAMLKLVEASLDRTEPDLVVFLGDNVHGPDIKDEEELRTAIKAVVDPVAARNIPFAVVFGNHDEECGISNDDQLLIYQEYDQCVATAGPELSGCGNYCLEVVNPNDPSAAYLLYFLDSGNKSDDGEGYGCVRPDQVDWMLQTHRAMTEKYTQTAAFVFQHIPVPQAYDLLEPSSFGTKGAITQFGADFFKWYTIKQDLMIDGTFGEAPCPSAEDSGEFAAWQQMGISAAFFGHDHRNDYHGVVDGVHLISTSGAGFYLYGREKAHGVRLLSLSASRFGEYQTGMLYYSDLTGEAVPGFLAASLGIQIRNNILKGAAGAVLAIAVIVIAVKLIIKRIKKGKNRKG